jgi:hypothetical protein
MKVDAASCRVVGIKERGKMPRLRIGIPKTIAEVGSSMLPEDHERLRRTLAELHAELQSVDRVDPEVRTLLESAIDDIHGKLDAPSAEVAEPQDDTIANRLTEAARHFEVTHPTLSGTLGSVIDALGRMGI